MIRRNQQMNNIPSLVNNIEQNIETYGNTNRTNYIPMEQNQMRYQNKQQQNMVYNPNIPVQNYQHQHQQQHPQIQNIRQAPRVQQIPQIPRTNPMINTIEHMDKKPSMFKNTFNNFSLLSLIKELVIYNILFIIFCHSKMTQLVCNNVPFLDNTRSNIPCISFKGLLMAIMIIILRKLLSF